MRLLLIAAFASPLIGTGIGFAQAQSADETARPAKVFTVQASQSELRREYPAIVLPSQEVELSFRVSGRVIELPVRGAQQVQPGDIIARLDPRDFETSIAQLESQRDQALAQLTALRAGARDEEIAALEAAVAAAQAQVDQIQDQVSRTQQLVERGVVAQAQLDGELAELRVGQANLQAQQEQLLIGQSGGRVEDVEAAEAALRGLETQIETANSNLADATLRAPFAGIVARRDIENFVNIQAGQSVVLLQALATVDIAFDIPGADVITLTRNGPGLIQNHVIFDALPGELFEAEFVEFSTQADAATQTYRGRVSVDVPDDARVLPGMVARVVTTAPSNGEPSLLVPLTGVAARPDGTPVVWIVDPANDSVSSQEVTLGSASADMVAITSGLSDGDTVVVAGVSQLQEGMVIRPVTQIGG